MVVTTSPHTKDLVRQLRSDHPNIVFVEGEDFVWSDSTKTLTYLPDDTHRPYLLHELAHALLHHTDFQFDIELIAQERAAWDKARTELGPRYKIEISPKTIEGSLDTYREWLYARSQCPRCNQTGAQNKTSTYVCINCRCSWHPNDARRRALRRSTIV